MGCTLPGYTPAAHLHPGYQCRTSGGGMSKEALPPWEGLPCRLRLRLRLYIYVSSM